MNTVLLQGNVTRDGEVKDFANGGSVTKFGVATNRNYQKDGEWKEEVQFIDCEYFRNVTLEKGDPVLVRGELQNQSWEKDGEKRYKTVVRVLELKRFAKFPKRETSNETTEPVGELVGAGAGGVGPDGIPF